jgi:hypothetical protein
MKNTLYIALTLLLAATLSACSGSAPQPTSIPVTAAPPQREPPAPTSAAVAPTAPQPTPVSVTAAPPQSEQPTPTSAAVAPTAAPAAAETAGEGAGGEAPLVSYADPAQGFSIDYPQPWTKDPAVTDGVAFVGDGSMTLAFVKPAAADPLAYATADAASFGATLTGYKQLAIGASAEVANAVVLGFESTGTSNVTGKAYVARGDRYYIALTDGRIAILTVISPVKNYDREGVRDIALTLKLAK